MLIVSIFKTVNIVALINNNNKLVFVHCHIAKGKFTVIKRNFIIPIYKIAIYYLLKLYI